MPMAAWAAAEWAGWICKKDGRAQRVQTALIGRRYEVVLTGWVTCAQARRLALVVGNDSYQSATPLQNARSDARAVARTLERAGFAVTLKEDLTLKAAQLRWR
jgi:hypothetical protein